MLARKKFRPGITVLMPCYNHASYIEQAVDSVLEQVVDIPIRLIILDDCSQDKTYEIVEAKARANPEIITLLKNKKNLGSGLASMQYHKPQVDTEFWCILEGDDYWCDSTKLQQQVDILRANPQRIGCAGLTTHILNDQPAGQIGSFLQEFNLSDLALHSRAVPFYIHTSSIIWRNTHEYECLPFPKSFYSLLGDPALMIAMLSNHQSIYRLNSVVSVYRSTGKGRWSYLSPEEQRARNKVYLAAVQKSWPLHYRIIRYMRIAGLTRFIKLCSDLGLLPAPINWTV